MVALRFDRRALGVAKTLIDSLVEASADDPYLRKLIGDGRHCHGFGYVLAGRRGGAWELTSRRFDAFGEQLVEEEVCERNLEELRRAAKSLKDALGEYEEVALAFHTRRTASEPRGTLNAHPFRAELLLSVDGRPELFELYLSHNGGVKKLELAETLGLPGAELMTDSHVLTHYLARSLHGSDVRAVASRLAGLVSDIKKRVLSSLDLNLLLFSRLTGPVLAAVGYVTSKDEDRIRYYEPVLVRGEGIAGYVSSTIRDLIVERGLGLEVRSSREGFVALFGPGTYELLPVVG
jgi:glutamine amidotransferase